MPLPAAPRRHVLRPEPLTAERFAPFGQLIQADPSLQPRSINGGTAQRFDSPACVDTAQGGGRTRVSLFRTLPRQLPLALACVERHALGSQLFMPLGPWRYLVVVAPAGPAPPVGQLRAFQALAGQGVNLAPGTWHSPLLSLDAGDYLVADRCGPAGAEDCEEHALQGVWLADAD